jgi:hypothetical protein
MANAFPFSIGGYGTTVRVYERSPGVIYIAYQRGRERRRDRIGRVSPARAREQALAVHLALLDRASEIVVTGEHTLGRLFADYGREMTRHKRDRYTRNTEWRAMEMFKEYFGPSISPSKIGEMEAMRYHRLRTSGAIDHQGKPVPKGDRKAVSDSTASNDLKTLRRILRWGVRNGFVDRNGLDGLEFKMNSDPSRPVMDVKRYKVMRDAARKVRSHFGSLRAWRDEESYCAVLLELAWHTSRRINAILKLRKEDYRPDVGGFGAVYWRADSDKTHRSGLTPLNAEAQRAIEEQLLRGLPGEWLFPAPMKPEDPLSKATARQWFLRAEEIAGLDHIPGGGWHMARRGFVTLRKGMSEADLAALGGWANAKVMRRVYQSSDFETMSKVVRNPAPEEE